MGNEMIEGQVSPQERGARMVQHQARQIQRRHHTVFTTLCGRMNKQCGDGMNIAATPADVTCKHCLRKLATGTQP